MPESSDVLATINAYATEGGLDGRFQPATCFNPMIALGHCEGPGDALNLWATYEHLLTAAHDHGYRAVRLDVSWARIEPTEGRFDHSALARYRDVLAFGRDLGLLVGIGSCDGAWPAWLGLEPWVWPWTQPVTRRYVETIAEAFTAADALVGLPRPGDLAPGFLNAQGPPWRRRATDDAQLARQRLAEVFTDCHQRQILRDWEVPFTHVRPLVAGLGPLLQAGPLLEPTVGGWRPAA